MPSVPAHPASPSLPSTQPLLGADSGVDHSLSHGHDLECADHCAMPCNWVDYYEAPENSLFTTTDEDPSTSVTLPVDEIVDTADKIFSIVGHAKTAIAARQKLRALSEVKVPDDGAITSYHEEKVSVNESGKTVMKTENFTDNRVARAKASRPLSQLRTLHKVMGRKLEKQREESIWKSVEQALLALTALAGAVGTILAVAGVAAAGPVGWVTLALGAALGICSGIHRVRNEHRGPMLDGKDEERLEALQKTIQAECMDHTADGHAVIGVQINGDPDTHSVTHWASKILNAGQQQHGLAWFDSARAFADVDLDDFTA